MRDDRTSATERAVQAEQRPKLRHLLRLFVYAFSSAKGISCIYLGLFLLLSLLRPLIAFLWGRYIQTAEAANALLPAALLLAGYYIINYLADLISRYVNPREQIERLDLVQFNHQQEKMHSKIYEKLAAVSPEFFEVPAINDRVAQVFGFVGEDWGGMNQQVVMQAYIVIAKTVSVLSIAASLYLFHPLLTLMVLVAPLPTLWAQTAGQKLAFKFRKDNTKLARRARYFEDMMISPAGKELKTLGLHDFFYGKWKTLADEYTRKEKVLIRTQMLLQMVGNVLVSLASVGGSVFAIVLMTMGRLTLGALGAVLSLISVLLADTAALLGGVATFLTKKNEAAQFFDLMELPEQRDEGDPCGPMASVEAVGLMYRYPLTERYVLGGVNLTIRKGEKVAFVGENGMGKTTFVKLLTGTLSPSEGELRINGSAAERLSPDSRYANLSAVVQDPARYLTFTVADNVFLGDTARARDETALAAALDFAGVGELPPNALLGKDIGGTDLSGGQWQKLAIARAVYRGRDFILLDEPTSNLDPLAETEVFQKYIALAADKTVIFVTHRISVAALADRIVVFADGKVAQDGTHAQLIAAHGEYARLYREQAKWYNR